MMKAMISEDLDHQREADARTIAEQLKQLHEQAYRAYVPAVEDICARDASEHEVDLFLDYLLDFAGEDKAALLARPRCL